MDRHSSLVSLWFQLELCAMAVLLTKGKTEIMQSFLKAHAQVLTLRACKTAALKHKKVLIHFSTNLVALFAEEKKLNLLTICKQFIIKRLFNSYNCALTTFITLSAFGFSRPFSNLAFHKQFQQGKRDEKKKNNRAKACSSVKCVAKVWLTC